MTKQNSFKERIRARMDKTGESYTAARRQLLPKSGSERSQQAEPATIARMRGDESTLRTNTGSSYDEWFARLDTWGATQRKHPEIAKWLVAEHGVAGWWAQHITVAYEQERGMRAPGQKSDGTYGVSASKTVNVSVDTLFEAFADEDQRERWMGDVDITVRTSKPGKSWTAAWEDGSSRLTAGFTAKGDAKSQVGLAHERITDPQRADELKTFWRERMVALKKVLEE